MAYFRNNQGDLVDQSGTVVNDPATRLQIGQSVNGDIGKLPLYSGTSTPTSLPTAGGNVGTGQQPPNPNPVPTPGTASGSTGGSGSQFTGYVKSDTNPTVYGKDAEGKYTAFPDEKSFLASGGNFANVQVVPGFNPGVAPIFGQQEQPKPTTVNPLAPGGISQTPTTPEGTPDYYKLYQQQLKQYGIGTGNPDEDPNQQLLTVNQQIAKDQQVLAPLQPGMVATHFPDALNPLKGGVNQAQLDLAAASAAAPIQTAMSFLIQSRTALSTFMTNAQTFATNAVEQAKNTYEAQLKIQSYDFTQIGSHVNELGETVPDYGYINKITGKILPATQPSPDNLTNQTYNASGFPQSIGTRPSPSNPNVTEYYNTQTGKGFDSAQALAEYYNKQTNSNTATASNVFGLLNSTKSNAGAGINNARTDRNSNPIAASIAINPDGTANVKDPYTSEWLTALDKANIPYSIEQGRNFGDRATINYATAQNGLDGSITLLGTSAFSWYKNHTGKTELAGISSPAEFKALPYSQKVSIVKGIYSHEQPGGALFNNAVASAPATANQSVQQQVAALTPALKSYVATSPTGYAFTTPNTPENFRIAIGAKAKDVVPLNADQAMRENSLITGMGIIANAGTLLDSLHLPTDPWDPDRIVNEFNQRLGSDPNLARLQQMWQGAIQTLQGLGVSGLKSQILIDRAALSDFPTAHSIDQVARAQLAGLIELLQTEERTLMGRPAPLDYSGYGSDVTQPDPNQSVYNSLNLNSILASGGLSVNP